MLPDDLRSALDAAAALPGVVLASDFDGTLAPFVENPMDSAPIDGAMDVLREASAMPGVTVALVSGRDVATLRELTGVEEGNPIVLVGSHGAQTTLAGAAGGDVLDDAARRRLDEVTQALEDVAARHPGARIEHKPSAVALHTRGLPDDVAGPALEEAARLGSREGVHTLPGKSVVELGVLTADKGSALRALQRAVGAEAVVYFGDDVTDEHAFTEFASGAADVTVKVGDGDTAARHRVPDIPAVRDALEAFVAARR